MNNEPSPSELMGAIVDLSEAVGRGFARVDAQLDRVEVRVTSIEGEVKGIQTWMARSDERASSFEGEVKAIQTWMARSDERASSIEGEVKGIHRWMARTDARFDAMERRKR